MIGLNQLWYKKQPRTAFHFFNDNKQWLQMDKAGHFFTAFHQSRIATDLLNWAGVSKKEALWYGGLSGFAFQLPIEILDGFSKGFGASSGDIFANLAGSLFITGQNLAWQEVRIMPQFSFHRTRFSSLRPSLLGNGLHQEIIKDYNGQSYWLSFNISGFLKNEKIPAWINLSLGYSGTGMIGGKDNVWKKNGKKYNRSDIKRKRQYYLSLDFNLRAINTNSKFLNSLLYLLDSFKFPFPALEFNKDKIHLHQIYY